MAVKILALGAVTGTGHGVVDSWANVTAALTGSLATNIAKYTSITIFPVIASGAVTATALNAAQISGVLAKIASLGTAQITVTLGTATVDAINDLAGITGGVITANLSDTLGNLNSLNVAVVNNYTVTITDASLSISDISDLNTLEGNTSGVVTARISGTATDMATLTGIGNAYTVTVLAGTATADDLNTINVATTVKVNATAITTITGQASDVAATVTAAGIDTAADVTVTLSGTVVAAVDLNAIDNTTTGLIDSGTVIEVTGTVEAVFTAVSSGFTGLTTAIGVTLSGAADATKLSALVNFVGGTIDGIGITVITGSMSATTIAAALATLDVAPTAAAVTITGSATAAQLTSIGAANGTGVITGTGITAITSSTSATDIAAAFAVLSGNTTATAVTITGSATAAQLIAIGAANGTGVITGTGITAIDGTATNILAAVVVLGATAPTNFSSSIDTSVTVATFANLRSLDGLTSGTISITDINITDTSGDSTVGYTDVDSDSALSSTDTFAIASTATLNSANSGMGGTGDEFHFSGTQTLISMAAAAAVTDGKYLMIRGDWASGGGGLFTVDGAGGADTLVLYDSDSTATVHTTGVVLIGIAPDALTAGSDVFSVT